MGCHVGDTDIRVEPCHKQQKNVCHFVMVWFQDLYIS